MTPETKKTIQVLRDAKGVLARDGWRQGGCGKVGGPSCLIGACLKAGGVVPHVRPVEDSHSYFSTDQMARLGGIFVCAVSGWSAVEFNDDDDTTVEDVYFFLDLAAEMLKTDGAK